MEGLRIHRMQIQTPVDIMQASIPKRREQVETVSMPKLDDQISTLEERLKQLKLRQQRSDARKRAVDAQRERKAETRRRFVVGTVIMAKVQEGEMDQSRLREWLDQALTRKDDRALFELPPKDGPPTAA